MQKHIAYFSLNSFKLFEKQCLQKLEFTKVCLCTQDVPLINKLYVVFIFVLLFSFI